MEELKALYRVCTLMKSDGIRCGSPCLKGANYCFQHLGGSIRSLTRATSSTKAPSAQLNLVYPGDRESIQHNLAEVARALNEGKIDNAGANTYNRLYRTCEQNLHRWETKKPAEAGDKMLPIEEEQDAMPPTEAEEPAAPAENDPAQQNPDETYQSLQLIEPEEPEYSESLKTLYALQSFGPRPPRTSEEIREQVRILDDIYYGRIKPSGEHVTVAPPNPEPPNLKPTPASGYSSQF